MVALALPVKQGLSAPAVNSIPQQWNAEWFRRFITNFLQNADLRNSSGNSGGVVVGGTVTSSGTITLNEFTSTTPGVVPASGGGTVNFLRADGTWAIPPGASAANPTVLVGLTAKNGSAVTFMRSDAAPALDQTISPTMTGLWAFDPSLANQTAIVVTSSNAATHSNADVNIQRAGSTANAFEEGANIQLTDSTAATFSVLQQSGGQTELWMGTGATQNHAVTWSNSGNMTVLAPPSGVALTVDGVTGSGALLVNAVGGTSQQDFQVTGSYSAGTITGNITNSSTSTTAAVNMSIGNGTHVMLMEMTSINFAGSIIPSGPTGEAALLASNGSIPLCFGSNHTYAGQISANQNWVLGPPTSGTALSAVGIAGQLNIAMTNGAGILQGNTGVPGFIMNSTGADFCMLENDSANVWSIAVGTSSSVLGTPILQWGNTGQFTALPSVTGTALGVLASQNGGINIGSTNNSAGTAALASVGAINNAGNAVSMQIYGSGYTGTPLTGGPTGQQAVIASSGAIPLSIGPSQTAMILCNATATKIIMQALAGSNTLQVLGNANSYSTVINGSGTTGQSYGLLIEAGSNSADHAFTVVNVSDSVEYFDIRGDGKISGGGITAGGLVDMTPDQGTFTASATGFTTTPTMTVSWSKMGNIVTLSFVGLSGTSNANTFTLTGLPAEIQPSTLTTTSPVVADVNNSVQELACQIIITAASGTMSLLRTQSLTGWTAALTKAINQCTITYQLK